MADLDLEQSFKGIVENVWKTLKPLGFRKQGQKFRRHAGGNVSLIEFQRSQTSDSNHIKFTVNLGFASGVLMERLDPEKDISKIDVAEAHLRERIGFLLPSKDDHWWQLLDSTNEVELGREVAQCILNMGIPYLDRVGTDDELIALWREEQSPGLTDGLRQRYLALLTS